jgi:GNAT superfamily N-acetyltransferase
MSRSILKEGAIRRARFADRQGYRDHLLRLSPKSRRSRFGGGVSDQFAEFHAARVFASGAIVHGWYRQGLVRAAAELHPVGSPAQSTAEAAFSVEEDFQDSGVGSALFATTLRIARNRGVSHLVLTCLPENARMQAVARKYGARLRWDAGDVLGLIDPPYPTPISIWREAIDEGHGILTVLFDPLTRQAAE